MFHVKHISTGSPFELEMAYSRAVIKGGWCFVSGVTGYDYIEMLMPEGIAAQAEASFQTINRVLSEAGFQLADIVRVQYTLVDAALVAEVSPVLSAYLGDVRPAATMIVAGLIKPEMLIEIEVTAFKG
jgi:enamine deaminase RidA (YjgF/YER057c/UK114 family)